MTGLNVAISALVTVKEQVYVSVLCLDKTKDERLNLKRLCWGQNNENSKRIKVDCPQLAAKKSRRKNIGNVVD